MMRALYRWTPISRAASRGSNDRRTHKESALKFLARARRGAVGNGLRQLRDYLGLPFAAKAENVRDRIGLPAYDPGIDAAVKAAIGWLGHAQDNSPGGDAGVPHSFSLVSGWNGSYPETTGYIVQTLIEAANLTRDESLLWTCSSHARLARIRSAPEWCVPGWAYRRGRRRSGYLQYRADTHRPRGVTPLKLVGC